MSTHKQIDRICAAAIILSLLLALLFMNAEALGARPAPAAMGYEARLFDTSRVHTIEIVMDGWDSFIETCENEEYAACSVVIDNEGYKNVGIRAKGNTSLSTVSQMGSDRYSFKIEFDQYDSGKTYYGLDKLCLNNLIQDNTMMKDYLTYRLMAGFGVNAPLCSYVYITVNGEDWGLYLAVEGVEDAFLQRNYGRDHGELYKPDSMSFGGGRGNGRDFDMEDFMNGDGGDQGGMGPSRPQETGPEGFDPASSGGQSPDQEAGDRPQQGAPPAWANGGQSFQREAGSASEGFDPSALFGGGGPGGFGGMGSSDVKLQYAGDDPDSYPNIFGSAKTELSGADQARLIRALKALDSGDAESALDIDQVLRYFVVHNFVVNADGYTGSMVHNYYLYEQDGQMSMIPWDYNLAFGTFQSGDASGAVNDPIDTPLSVTGDGSRPMADWILARQEYTQLYHQYFREFLDSAGWAAIIEQAYGLIAPYVERDPTKFCTYQEFEAGVQALTAFCTLRSQSVDGQLSGSIPSTNKGQAADSSNLVDASTLSLAQMGTMEEGRPGASSAFLGGPGGESSAFPGEPGGESDTFPEGGGVPAMGDGDAIGNRRPAGGAQAQDGFPGSFPHSGGAPGGESAKIDAAALALLGISVLTLLAGILVSFRFRRSGRLRARGASPG